MSEMPSSPDSREVVVGEFLRELEQAADGRVVIRKYAAAHPHLAADFRELAATEGMLNEARPVAELPTGR